MTITREKLSPTDRKRVLLQHLRWLTDCLETELSLPEGEQPHHRRLFRTICFFVGEARTRARARAALVAQ